MKVAAVHMCFKMQDLAAVLAYTVLKQNKHKARKSVDTMRNHLDGDVSFNKFVQMFDISLYF